MSLILSGTDGLSDVDGTAATPAIRGTDANTGIFFPAADTIAFSEGGAEAMRIDSSGNVGIGTGSPTYKLDVQGGISSFTNSSAEAVRISKVSAIVNSNEASRNLVLYSTDSYAADLGPQMSFGGATNGGTTPYAFATIAGRKEGTTSYAGYLQFSTTTGTSAVITERMRIDSSGNLLVGTTTNYGSARTSINNSGTVLGLYCSGASGTTGMVIGKESNDASTSQVLMQFLYNNGSSGLGQINGNGGSQAAFGSYSDIRLKENIIDLPSQLDNIMALRPVEFDWKDGTGHQIGFIAQEVNEVYPDVVGIGANEMLTLTDMNKNDARLIKCIQEQQALITALTARITALETP